MPKLFLKPKAQAGARSEIDWEAVRLQIETANRKLAEGEEMSAEALDEAWARRSLQMAQKIQDEEQGEVLKAAIISLDNELYGLDVRHIFDIRDLERITFVPRVPPWVLGVVNWRGRILSVVDFRRFLGLSANGAEGKGKAIQRLLVVQAGEMEVGLRVDEIYLIETIPYSQIRKEEGEVRGIKPELVDGVFIRAGLGSSSSSRPLQGATAGRTEAKTVEANHEGEGIVVLLNLPTLLADPRLIIREEVM